MDSLVRSIVAGPLVAVAVVVVFLPHRHGADAAAEVVRGAAAPADAVVGPGVFEDGPRALSPAERFAGDVALHVVLHEVGHALVREFDLPVLGNEETLADAFATHYLVTHLPDRAHEVLAARIASLMIEAEAVPRAEWSVSGEHNSDARRAFQIAALAVAADPERYTDLAEAIGMPSDDIAAARDFGTEIHRSWRRLLRPLWMPEGEASREARVELDPSDALVQRLCTVGGLADEVRAVLQRFDWHSQVTVRFAQGDGGAGWDRSERTITVHSEYLQRFVEQGRAARGG